MTQKPPFQSILFPVDFSQMSDITAPHVRGLAQQTGATVTLLHVVPWLSGWYGATELRPPVMGDESLRELQDTDMLALEAFQKKHFLGLRCFRHVKEGAVAETITDTAKENAADLIMMPTRGLGPARRFLIGSTTAKVLHDAPCPVCTSPHLRELGPFAGFHHLLCTINRDEVLPDFLREAVDLASYFGSKISFVTAVPSTIGGSGEKRRIRALDKEYPQADLHDQLGGGLDCTVYVETGPVGEVVRRLVEDQAVDLVVTNRGHLQHPFGKLRTHAYEIVLESPCPVLSLCISANVEAGEDTKSKGNSEMKSAVERTAG
jgi:nucleotide-binding universal stress UspA family protein